MLYLVINPYGETVGRFLSIDRAIEYLKERNDNSFIQEMTFEEYEEMIKNFFKNVWQIIINRL